VAVTCFSALIFVSILFFTDFETQRQNMFPMLFFCVTCLIGSIIGLVTIHGGETWTFAVLGALAVSLLIGCAAKLGKEFVRECKKYFCTK
jgi:prepilin signal peptidase PulO-like enzyme (type II secretory pathway)